MLQQIISHTPIYVWAILAFLISRGVAASTDRTVSLRSLFIIPAVMLALSLQDLDNKFSVNGAVLGAWLVSLLAGAALAWQLLEGVTVSADRAAGTVTPRGSWMPLALMMAIFFAKYSVAVMLAIQPAARHSMLVAVIVGCAFGLFNGIFVGRLARHVAAYLRQPSAALA